MAKFLDENGLLYLWGKIKGLLPTKVSQLSNDSGFITAFQVPAAPSASATTPKMNGTAAVGTDAGFARGDHVHPSDTNKVDKVSGKGLSTNDYTTAEKNKLAGIATGANAYSLPTASSTVLGGVKVGTNLTITEGVLEAKDTTYAAATSSAAGLMSAADKGKLDGIAEGANAYTLPTATASVKGGVTVGTNLSVSSGKISVADGSTSAKGVVKLSSDTNSTSEALAATPKAVKLAYDLAAGKQSPATTLSGYGITDAYTKTQIDSKLSGALHYKGTKATYADLPTTGNATGDVWNITAASAANGVKAGDNVAWNGTEWDVLAGTVDLSSYLLSSSVISNAEIDTIVAS